MLTLENTDLKNQNGAFPTPLIPSMGTCPPPPRKNAFLSFHNRATAWGKSYTTPNSLDEEPIFRYNKAISESERGLSKSVKHRS